jgi:APA family basic amino acid/polyamine antiporter
LRRMKRDIGLFEATIYSVGCIIGAGIYVLIGKAAGIAGSSLWLSFLLAAVIAVLTGLSYAELASTYPVDSAEYRYSQMAFRDRRFSFGMGWLKAFTMLIAASAVCLGFGGYLSNFIGVNPVLCAMGLLVFMVIINLFGLKNAIWIDTALVLLTVGGLVLIIATGMGSIGNVDHLAFDTGWSGMFTGATLVFFAFLGFEAIGNIGQEVKNPRKTLPRAVLISVLACTVLYVLVALVAVSVVPWHELAGSSAPLADVINALLGSGWAVILGIMALFATASTVLATFVSGFREFYGMAEEKAFPRSFEKLNRWGVPFIPVIVSGIIAALFILPGDITWVAFMTDFGTLFLFMIVNIALIVIRYKEPDTKRGFTVPLSIGRFPVLPALGAATCFGFMLNFDKKMFLLGILFILLGMVLYMIFWERKHERHIVKKVAGGGH